MNKREKSKSLKWHNFYMSMAKSFAAMSKDPKTKVGCVIVTEHGILYPGYNGDEKGGDNKRDSVEDGCSGFVHAEANALVKYNPTIHRDSKIYITHNPCVVCARMIVNAQSISEVYYTEEYRDTDGIKILKKRGVRCVKI